MAAVETLDILMQKAGNAIGIPNKFFCMGVKDSKNIDLYEGNFLLLQQNAASADRCEICALISTGNNIFNININIKKDIEKN